MKDEFASCVQIDNAHYCGRNWGLAALGTATHLLPFLCLRLVNQFEFLHLAAFHSEPFQ